MSIAVLFVMAVLLAVYSILRGYNPVTEYAAGSYYFDYSGGFLRRGLPGTIAGLIGKFTPIVYSIESVHLFALTVFGANLVFLALATLRMMKSRDPAAIAAALVYVSGFGMTTLAQTSGYWEQVGYLAVWISLGIKKLPWRLTFLVFSMSTLALCHEGAWILVAPTAFVATFIESARMRSRRDLAWTVAGVAVAMVPVFLVVQARPDPRAIRPLYERTQSRIDFRLDPLFDQEFLKDVPAAFRSMRYERTQPAYQKMFLDGALVTLPALMFLLSVLLSRLHLIRHRSWLAAMAVAAVTVPLALHLVAWDVCRWDAAPLHNALILSYQTVVAPTAISATDVRRHGRWIAAAIIIVAFQLWMTGPPVPRGYTHAYPFAEQVHRFNGVIATIHSGK